LIAEVRIGERDDNAVDIGQDVGRMRRQELTVEIRQVDAVRRRCLARVLDGMCQQRFAEEGLYVLPRDSLRTAPGWDDRQISAHRLSSSPM
jgi:hypothetical protein